MAEGLLERGSGFAYLLIDSSLDGLRERSFISVVLTTHVPVRSLAGVRDYRKGIVISNEDEKSLVCVLYRLS